MIQVRRGVFETNSSSTHSLSVTTEDDYDKWANGGDEYYLTDTYDIFRRYLPDGEDGVYSREVIQNAINEYAKWSDEHYGYSESFDTHVLEHSDDIEIEEERRNSRIYDLGIYTYYDWQYKNDYMELYEQHFTTPSGDKMIAFGSYGYDN